MPLFPLCWLVYADWVYNLGLYQGWQNKIQEELGPLAELPQQLRFLFEKVACILRCCSWGLCYFQPHLYYNIGFYSPSFQPVQIHYSTHWAPSSSISQHFLLWFSIYLSISPIRLEAQGEQGPYSACCWILSLESSWAFRRLSVWDHQKNELGCETNSQACSGELQQFYVPQKVPRRANNAHLLEPHFPLP